MSDTPTPREFGRLEEGLKGVSKSLDRYTGEILGRMDSLERAFKASSEKQGERIGNLESRMDSLEAERRMLIAIGAVIQAIMFALFSWWTTSGLHA